MSISGALKKLDMSNVDKSLFDEFDLEQIFEDDINQTNELFSDLLLMTNAVEQLSYISEVISQYGLTRSIMEAADPNNELVKAGLIGSYEFLNNTESNHEENFAAIESIGESIKDLVDGISRKISDSKNRITSIFDSFKNLVANLPEQLEEYKGLINTIELDKDKLATKKIRSIPYDDLDMIDGVIKNLTDPKIFSEVERMVKSIVDRAKTGSRIGVINTAGNIKDLFKSNQYVNNYQGQVKLLSKKIDQRFIFDTLTNLGYNDRATVISAIDKALEALKDLSGIEKYISDFNRSQTNAVRGIKGLTRFSIKRNAISDIGTIYALQGVVISKLLRTIKKVLKGIMTVARATYNVRV